MKECAAGSRGEEVEMEVAEERLEDVEEAGPSHEPKQQPEEAGPGNRAALQKAAFKGMGRGAAMRHLVLPPSIGKRGKCIVCIL